MQRSGRAGREAPGKCFRLYTEATYLSLVEATVPEILRSDIASAVLTLKARGITNAVDGFDYLSPPSHISLLKAHEHLFALGALTADGGAISPLGRQMATFPLPPPFARVLLAAAQPHLDVLAEAIDIVATLVADTSLFRAPPSDDLRDALDQARAVFRRSEGDHLMLLAVVRAWDDAARDGADGRRRWCDRYGVHARAMATIDHTRKQLRTRFSSPSSTITTNHASQLEPKEVVTPDMTARILKAFLAGFFMNTARLVTGVGGSGVEYRTVMAAVDGGQTVAIHPSSTLFGARREAIVFAEFVYTTRPFARWCSAVQLDWIVEAGPEFLRSGV